MTITRGNINTTVRLTELERRAMALTGMTKEEVLLRFRYRPINPIEETQYTYIYQVHHYVTFDCEVRKADCVEADGHVYCRCIDYNRKRYTY